MIISTHFFCSTETWVSLDHNSDSVEEPHNPGKLQWPGVTLAIKFMHTLKENLLGESQGDSDK